MRYEGCPLVFSKAEERIQYLIQEQVCCRGVEAMVAILFPKTESQAEIKGKQTIFR